MDTYIETCEYCYRGYIEPDLDLCKKCGGNYTTLTYIGRDLLDFLELMGIEIPDPKEIRYN